jgi:carbon-monoxide dehydrogenase medium subunit
MRAFDYYEPKTIAEACAMLAEAGPGARPLAGGTDLLIQLEMGKFEANAVVYLGRVAELARIEDDPAMGLRIGAAAPLRDIELHPAVRERYPALERGTAEIGSVQIRNLATLGGNVCNASPSADTSPALLAYDAAVEIAGGEGTRRLSIDEFWTGPGRTRLRAGEIVTAICLPPPPAGLRSFYCKLAVRKAMDLAMVGVSITAVPRNGGLERVRIALGACAPICRRAGEAEALATGGDLRPDRIDAAAAAAVTATAPIDDHRASASYRREMVRVLTRRGLNQVMG